MDLNLKPKSPVIHVHTFLCKLLFCNGQERNRNKKTPSGIWEFHYMVVFKFTMGIIRIKDEKRFIILFCWTELPKKEISIKQMIWSPKWNLFSNVCISLCSLCVIHTKRRLLHVSPHPGSSGRDPPRDLRTSLLFASSVAPLPRSNPCNTARTLLGHTKES